MIQATQSSKENDGNKKPSCKRMAGAFNIS